MREGSFLGEVALLRPNTVRTVDVRSVTDALLLALDIGSFNVVVAAHEEYGDGRMQAVLKKNAYTRYAPPRNLVHARLCAEHDLLPHAWPPLCCS